MPNFILNGLNNTVINTVNFSRTSATTETAIVAPTANLYMTAADWNTLFSFGENIYHTYSGELPVLTSHAVNFTNTGNGTGAVLDYVTTDASDKMTIYKFASGGARYAIGDSITFIVASQGTSKDDVSSAAHTLVAADLDLDSVKHELTSLTIATADGSNYTAGEYVAGPNIDDGIYTDLISYESASSGAGGTGATLTSITVASNQITGVAWSAAGSGYATGDTFVFTIGSTKFATYTVVNDDHNTGAMQTMTGKTIAKFITVVHNAGCSGSVVNRVTVSGNQITKIGFSAVGSSFAANNTLTVTIDGTAFAALTLAATQLTGSLKTTAITFSTPINFVNGSAAGTFANDVITIGVSGGSGVGAIVDTLTVNASHQITAITFAGRGYGYAADETFTFTSVDANGTSRASAAYTLLSADLNSDGSVKDITGKTIAAAGGATAYSPVAVSTRYNKRTLAINKLQTPAGTALRESEETEQTIADDAIRHFLFGITGSYNQQGTFSNLETVNTTIDNLLTGTGALTLVAKLKASILAANGDTDSTTDTGNLSRQLFLQLSSGEAARLSTNTYQQYHNDNVLSNLVGDLSGIASTSGTYTTADGIAATFANGGVGSTGSGELLESITVRDGKLVGVKFSKPGKNFLATNTVTLTGSGLRTGTFTVDNASVSNLTNGTAATYTDVALTGGTTSGTGAKATVVVADATTITSITITTPGKGYANGDTVTLAAGTLGGSSDVVTLTLVTADIGTVTFSTTYALVAGDIDSAGGLSNNLHNFLFEAGDTLTFQCTVSPKTDATNSGQTSINYAIKVTMI